MIRLTTQLSIHPTKVVITELKLDKDGKKFLNAKPNLNKLKKRRKI